MSIIVGSITFNNGKRIYPKTPENYILVEVMTKCSKYASLSPYILKNDQDHIMENIWQFSKIYENIPYAKQVYSKWNDTVIWEHPKEQHIKDNKILPAYWNWREKGFNATEAIRYPVGFHHRSKCIGLIPEYNKDEMIDYIESRKKVYVPLYIELVKKQEQFLELKSKLDSGINLFILEVDGPKFSNKYNTNLNITKDNTILITKENINILLNEKKYPFGHGYCLAMALLDINDY